MSDRMIEVHFLKNFALERIAFRQGDRCEMPITRALGLREAGIIEIEGVIQNVKPSLAGMLRIRNEERWIEEVLLSMLPVCTAGVVVFDDSSDDQTPAIVARLAEETRNGAGFRIVPIASPYPRSAGIDEGRDKDFLVKRVMETFDPDWILCVDGDEVLAAGADKAIAGCIEFGNMWSYSLKIAYLWDRVDQVRTDGIYGNFWRPSLFFTRATTLDFKRTAFGGNFHCSNVPADLLSSSGQCRAQLKHYGYMDRDQRVAKWRWYNSIDPGNQHEDCYRHVVQGDIPEVPRDAELLHAGPLRLAPWI